MLGETYNQRVDLFSYAMCLVELIDCDLPWHGWRFAAEVPFKVIQGERPAGQLTKADKPAKGSEQEKEQMANFAALVKELWSQKPSERPSFLDAAQRVDEMYMAVGGRRISDRRRSERPVDLPNIRGGGS